MMLLELCAKWKHLPKALEDTHFCTQIYFMTRDEFEKMFDLTNYEKIRRKYHAVGAFPHLYDKVKPEIDVIKVGKDFMDPL